MDEAPLLEVNDFEDKAAKVKVYPNRIDRERRNFQRLEYDTETIPVRSITGVSMRRDGMAYSRVDVNLGSSIAEFKLGHKDAEKLRNVISELMFSGGAVQATTSISAAAPPPPPPPSAPQPAGWYADPSGRHEHRYHNGIAWSEHVANQGQTAIDPL